MMPVAQMPTMAVFKLEPPGGTMFCATHRGSRENG